MPESEHVLNIFEPRYRKMYNDILFNGSRRFVVPVSRGDGGVLSASGVVFYLEDLKEVSEQTQDQAGGHWRRVNSIPILVTRVTFTNPLVSLRVNTPASDMTGMA